LRNFPVAILQRPSRYVGWICFNVTLYQKEDLITVKAEVTFEVGLRWVENVLKRETKLKQYPL